MYTKFGAKTLNHISRTPNSIKVIKNGIMFVFYLRLPLNTFLLSYLRVIWSDS